MSKYLKISSVSNTTVEDLFTLGVSTSRGKDGKIGQFGSGTLMGVLCWMRAYDAAPVFYVNGQKVNFTVKPVQKSDGEIFHQILMNRKPLSVALEYGAIDWNDARMSLREWICNALDAGATNPLSLVDTQECHDNEVCVFVPYNAVCRDYFANIGQYILHFAGKQNEKILTKNKISKMRIYRKGIFVRELDKMSMFDYNLNIDINECRTGSSDSIQAVIDSEITWSNDHDFINTIIDAVLRHETCYEVDDFSYSNLYGSWKQVLADRHERICMPRLKAENCIAVEQKWYSRIVRLAPHMDGLDSMTAVAARGLELHPVQERGKKLFNRFCEAFEMMGMDNGKQRPKLEYYGNADGTLPDAYGMYDTKRQTVMIWSQIKDNMESSTLIHELCHHYSGADDYSREFIDFAHEAMARLIGTC